METKTQVGDVVQATAGRDKDGYFLVVGETETSVTIVNGKTRKIKSPKTKSKKHTKIILSGADKPLAERIAQGKPTSNKKVISVVSQVKKSK